MNIIQDPLNSAIRFEDFRIAGRAIIVQNNRLLFVSDDGYYWYLPGGRVEKGEDLRTCIEREVYEETGFTVKAEDVLHVQEMLDIRDKIHKIFFYFHTSLIKGELDESWKDSGGAVQYRQFFSLEEIRNKGASIFPPFLEKGSWLKKAFELSDPQNTHSIYTGCLVTRGFEVVKESEFNVG